jgi:hypothetical protein
MDPCLFFHEETLAANYAKTATAITKNTKGTKNGFGLD